jgi:ankyrin repeat protein
MSADPQRALPENPSSEHLRKQAKRLARQSGLQLAKAQHQLAQDYGFADWAALIGHVRALEPQSPLSPLAQAARDGDLARVRQLLAAGHDPNEGGPGTSPVWEACSSAAPPATRLAMVRALIEAGGSARKATPGQRPLHIVAERGPFELAELLIRHGAIEWEPNEKGRSALDIARRSRSRDRAAMVELLDRPVIRDPSFRAAVDAIHAGDVARLKQLLDAEPRLLTERIREPDCYRDSGRDQYFLDPKLFWFIANNPTLIDRMPANMPQVARAMIRRGVPQEDLDISLGLAMTSSQARENGLQIPLVEVLTQAGARAQPEDMGGILGHCETEIVEYLVAAGMPLTAPVAAGLGRLDVLAGLLASATPKEIDEALDLAVINGQAGAVRLALEAGATVNRRSSQHRHSNPIHQAALVGNTDILDLLAAHGADLTVVDDLWDGVPWGWAIHGGHPAAVAWFEARLGGG